MPNLRCLSLVLLLAAGPVAGQDLVVDPAGPVPTLRAALALATPGAHIEVRPGVYRDSMLIIDTPVTIEGIGWPVFDAEQQHQILTITADSVAVRGLVFRNVGTSYVEDRAAIKVDEAHDCLIQANRFEDTFFGIYLAQSRGCRIVGNEIHGMKPTESASANGIHLWYSRDVLIQGNTVRGHRDGIYLEFVEDSEVIGNLSTDNRRYGLHFMFSDRCAYRDNEFRDNDAGVAVMYTKHVEMRGNRFVHNWGSASFGLLLKDITDSEVEDNVFERNSIGILAEGSNRVSVADNLFLQNGWAVKIMANSEDNRFSRNDFIGNSFDVATNSRRSYSTFEGNYWDHYRGYDLDRDGVGDVPYRPVRLFALMAEQNEPTLLLMRSLFVQILDAAEQVLPTLTPETLVDARPSMQPFTH